MRKRKDVSIVFVLSEKEKAKNGMNQKCDQWNAVFSFKYVMATVTAVFKEWCCRLMAIVGKLGLHKRKSETKPNDVQGAELILIDQNGDTIQASINKRLTRLFLEHLNEGSTYKIRRFSISSNRVGLDMATYHPCKIWFEYSTRVVPIPNAEIPLCTHAFYTFNEVVIGAMPGRLYIEIEQEFINKQKPTLVMLFLKRSVYEGEVSITTTWGATKILVNPNMNEVNVFNNCLPLLNCTISLTSFPDGDESVFGAPGTAAYHPPILASANIKTLTEITNLTRGGAYVTMAKILELDTSGNSWYYYSCKECRSKVKQGEDGLWFQVKFFVTYEAPDLLEFIIWDDVMAELLGKTARAILDEDEIYTIVPPPDFRPLLERTFVAKIRVNQLFNIEQKSNSYEVISLYDDPRKIAKWDAMNNARKEKMREIVESEPVLNSEEITPQKGVVLMAEASNKSSATKLKEIKMGKQPMAF
ncbi:uncharacterized protein LOC141617825 [Silene latifolia]|uniref:uncharacterized protein LOC141617825 n=1 Tax=Silene latifolia TaxID=37657 RepID=UPI003D777595